MYTKTDTASLHCFLAGILSHKEKKGTAWCWSEPSVSYFSLSPSAKEAAISYWEKTEDSSD